MNENHRRRIFGSSKNVVQIDPVDDGTAVLEARRPSEVADKKTHDGWWK